MKRDIDPEWAKLAASILRTELTKQKLTYEQLSTALKKVGVEIKADVLNRKINRGTFSFAFFLQCVEVLGMTIINLEYFKTPNKSQ